MSKRCLGAVKLLMELQYLSLKDVEFIMKLQYENFKGGEANVDASSHRLPQLCDLISNRCYKRD